MTLSSLGPNWWRGAVLYQIYPRSFRDSNGDGIGDLAGIVEKLDHLAWLGVDAIWISPFFPSPMKDFGYDVSDYLGVDPIFGTLDDFERVTREAHARGLKVMIDQVWSHTSDEHPWFQESRQSRDNAKADWFVWADPAPDGTAPNNWLSVFGGGAWSWDPRRCQYYLHHFLSCQPQLNLRNDEVLAHLLESARIWIERGVDGFRFDAIDFMLHDAALRSNPARPSAGRKNSGQAVRPAGTSLRHGAARDRRADRTVARFHRPLLRRRHLGRSVEPGRRAGAHRTVYRCRRHAAAHGLYVGDDEAEVRQRCFCRRDRRCAGRSTFGLVVPGLLQS